MSPPDRARPARVLVAMFQGGGNIPLIMPIVARLASRGNRVRVIIGPGVHRSRLPISEALRQRIEATGATLIPLREPAIHPRDEAATPRGVAFGYTPRPLRSTIQATALTALWSAAWAEHVAAELRHEPADVLAADFFLVGALAAAEAAALPTAVLMHNVYWFPTPGLPPPGLGFLPARGPLALPRDAVGNAVVHRIFARDGLPAHNRARKQLGLAPLRSLFQQFERADRVLVLTSAAFDFRLSFPANVRHVGKMVDDGSASPWEPPWEATDAHPVILISLSTVPQGQSEVMHRILEAVATLPIQAVVTLGPSLDPSRFSAAPNIRLETYVPHTTVLPHVAAVVTQGGLGTVMKALAHGLPLVCIPILGDQQDNAARVVARGAGVRLSCDASVQEIRTAIQRVLVEPRFREGARSIGLVLAKEDGAEVAAEEIESLV
jgi:UDP:flavonoid glycosyltransferase YjiC (YdhE family)